MAHIVNLNAIIVLKDMGCLFKVNAVFPYICRVLFLVPLKEQRLVASYLSTLIIHTPRTFAR